MLKHIRSTTEQLYTWYGKKTVLGGLVIVLTLATTAIFMHVNGDAQNSEVITERVPAVQVSPVSAFNANGSIDVIGTVEAVNEVRLESEAGGRITAVPVALGQQVSAGSVIARIENADERAALLQAEGSYESAVAAAASSDINVNEARNNAQSVYRNAYATVQDVVINTIDDLFSDPEASTPGLRIDGFGNTTYLNRERVALRSLLSEWQQRAASLSIEDDLPTSLHEARTRVIRTQEIVRTFLDILPRQNTDQYTQTELQTFQNRFVTAQNALNATLDSIDSARESLASAAISGTGNSVSAADAQIKQALGSLRAAQANYEKTIVRTPIGGTVNTLSVRTGDYIGINSSIGIIANNDTLLVTTFVSEANRDRFSIGSAVRIEGDVAGVVTNRAPAVDPTTKKIEVKIEVDEGVQLTNGDTVRLSIEPDEKSAANENIIIPVKALKVGTERTVVFTVSDANTLVAHEVETGPLVGSGIIILSGLTQEMQIVEDARGLNEGDDVTVIQ